MPGGNYLRALLKDDRRLAVRHVERVIPAVGTVPSHGEGGLNAMAADFLS